MATIFEKLRFNSRGLIPAIAQQHDTKDVLMLAWMSRESIEETLATGRVTYYSRSRQALWRKGESSGQTQMLVDMRLDCDGDALLILRDGRVVATLTTAATSKQEFVEGIVGRKFERHARGSQTMERAKASVAIEGLSGQSVDGVSMDLSPGEVVGLTGLVGSGYADVPYLL